MNGKHFSSMVVLISVVFLISIQIVYKIPVTTKWLAPVFSAGDIVTFVGTVFLGAITIFQTKQANDISKYLLEIEKNRSVPAIDILPICENELNHIKISDILQLAQDKNSFLTSEAELSNRDSESFLWFKIANVKECEIISIDVSSVCKRILDDDGNCICSKKYDIITSCGNYISAKDHIPFFISYDDIWAGLTDDSRQSLVLEIVFNLTGIDGKNYLQTYSMQIVHKHYQSTLSPSIIAKQVSRTIIANDAE